MQFDIQNEEQINPRFFLVNHGRYYAKEILFGGAFVPKDQVAEAELMCKIRTGDVIFHASRRGIAAVGWASRPCRVLPYPAWRYADGLVGDRGYWLDTKDLLLKEPIETGLPSDQYLILLSDTQAKEILSQIFDQIPRLKEFFCVKKSFFLSNPVEFS